MRELDSLEMIPMRIRVASTFCKAILSSEFKEGEELSLTDIANNLGASRTLVHKTFQILSSGNLIPLRMNKRVIVKGIITKTIRGHFKTRSLLEGEAAVRATLRHFDVSELMESQVHIEGLGENFTDDEYQSYNQNLRTSIWRAADNSRMYSTLFSLWNRSSFGKTISAKDYQILLIREHRNILKYIQPCNPYLMRREMEHHIKRSMNNIIDSFSLKENE